MGQIGIVFAAMALGLGLGRLTGGLAFSPAVCILAGVFLVTPALLRLDTGGLRAAAGLGRWVALDLGLNFVVLAAAALAIGWLSGDAGLTAALLLLALLPGGGMVMHWIRVSGADARLGFLLSAVNLAMVLPVSLAIAAWPGPFAPWFAAPPATAGGGLAIPPLGPFLVLVVLPFVLSRWARAEAPGLVDFVERHGRALAQGVIAAIVFYLFALESAQALFEVPAATLARGGLATLGFYAAALALAALAPRSAQGRAVLWHLVTRYVTLALIFAAFLVERFGPSFLVPIMAAYVIQFALAGALGPRLAARAP